MSDTDRQITVAGQIGELKAGQQNLHGRLDHHGEMLQSVAEATARIEAGMGTINERCQHHSADIGRAHHKIEAHISAHHSASKSKANKILQVLVAILGPAVGVLLTLLLLTGCIREAQTVTAERRVTEYRGKMTNPLPNGPLELTFALQERQQGHIEEDSTNKTTIDGQAAGEFVGAAMSAAGKGMMGDWGGMLNQALTGLTAAYVAYRGTRAIAKRRKPGKIVERGNDDRVT